MKKAETLIRGKCDNCHRVGVLLVRIEHGRRFRYECLVRRDCTEAVVAQPGEAA